MDGVGSFGAGRAGAVFDPIAYIQQPTTILRLVAWVRLFFFSLWGVSVMFYIFTEGKI